MPYAFCFSDLYFPVTVIVANLYIEPVLVIYTVTGKVCRFDDWEFPEPVQVSSILILDSESIVVTEILVKKLVLVILAFLE